MRRSRQAEGGDLGSLRDALLAGLCQAHDGGLREHCAALVAELLHWTCKHTPAGARPLFCLL